MEWLVLMGQNIDDTADAEKFTVDQMGRWCKRTIFLEDEATSDDSWNFTQDVPKLQSFTQWYTWLEAFDTALQRKRTPGMGIPMSYLIRKETETIQWDDIEDDNPRYDNLDMLLMHTAHVRKRKIRPFTCLVYVLFIHINYICCVFISMMHATSYHISRGTKHLIPRQ